MMLTTRRITALALILLALTLVAAPVSAQDETPPNPQDPITVDFVKKDIHTVMHYIALRSGLQIIVQGEIDVQLTVMYRNVVPRDAIQSICKANRLDFIEDGKFIIIKERPQDTLLANVVNGDSEGRYNVNFESHDLVAAIMEVASITNTDVYVPAVPVTEERRSTPGQQEEEQQEQRITRIQQRKISMYMREATPDSILRRLASLGALQVETEPVEEGSDKEGYFFKYPQVRTDGPGPIGNPDVEIESRQWIIPGAEMSGLTSLENLLSPNGRVVTEEYTDLIVVFDTPEALERISAYLDPLSERFAMLQAEAALTADSLVVREYRLMRDASDVALLASIQGVLSENGRILNNPDRNSLIVYELESRITDIDEIMKLYDSTPEQVLITAKLIEITLDEYMGYGLEWFTSQPADNLNDGTFTGSAQDTAGGTVGGLFGQPTGFDPFFGTFSNSRLDVRLELLANEGRVETLSQPTQMVSNRQTATITVGQEVPYLENTSQGGGTAIASIAFRNVAISMEITPTVLEGGLIRLDVRVTVEEIIGNVAIEGNNTPVIINRESTTNVFIHDGETLVMGGLIRERERNDENGLPFLKDIPFLGYLFKSANKTTNKTDLMFFLRPQIVTAGKRSQHGKSGLELERDLRPLIYEDGDDKAAQIRPSNVRKLGRSTKPKWYNEKTRPKTAADVKPGA